MDTQPSKLATPRRNEKARATNGAPGYGHPTNDLGVLAGAVVLRGATDLWQPSTNAEYPASGTSFYQKRGPRRFYRRDFRCQRADPVEFDSESTHEETDGKRHPQARLPQALVHTNSEPPRCRHDLANSCACRTIQHQRQQLLEYTVLVEYKLKRL